MKTHPVVSSRRDFVRQACCAAVGTTGILSALTQLRVIGAIAADAVGTRATAAALPADYKALVCLFLNGGNDGTNLIVPSDTANYNAYAQARSELALGRASLLPITPKSYSDGRTFGLHSAVPEIQSLFAQRKLAFLANVGTLVQPTTLAQYKSGRGLPPQLFSHLDQLTQWQSSIPDKPFTTGWGGRLGDMVDSLNGNHQISMAITLSGVNSFQVGNKVAGYSVNPTGATLLRDFTTATTGIGALR